MHVMTEDRQTCSGNRTSLSGSTNKGLIDLRKKSNDSSAVIAFFLAFTF